jgi:hypothetical protein
MLESARQLEAYILRNDKFIFIHIQPVLSRAMMQAFDRCGTCGWSTSNGFRFERRRLIGFHINQLYIYLKI